LVFAHRRWWRRFGVGTGGKSRAVQSRKATTVEQSGTAAEVPPWERDSETDEEKERRYAREAEEMRRKWDARRLEEKHAAQRRLAWAAAEQERESKLGPRDLIMEAYEGRLYEEARVLEVRRRQREVYERVKAAKAGQPLPPKGKEFVPLQPLPVEPPKPEEFDISGKYDFEKEAEEQKYRAPESFKSPTGNPNLLRQFGDLVVDAAPPESFRGADESGVAGDPVGRRPTSAPQTPSSPSAPPLPEAAAAPAPAAVPRQPAPRVQDEPARRASPPPLPSQQPQQDSRRPPSPSPSLQARPLPRRKPPQPPVEQQQEQQPVRPRAKAQGKASARPKAVGRRRPPPRS